LNLITKIIEDNEEKYPQIYQEYKKIKKEFLESLTKPWEAENPFENVDENDMGEDYGYLFLQHINRLSNEINELIYIDMMKDI